MASPGRHEQIPIGKTPWQRCQGVSSQVFQMVALTNDHCVDGTAVDGGAGHPEDQSKGVIARGKLTGVIPAHLVGGGTELLIQRADQYFVHEHVEFAEGDAAFIDQAERLPCKLEGYRSAIRGRPRKGTVDGVRTHLLHPSCRVDKGAVFVIVFRLLRGLCGLICCCGRRLDRDAGGGEGRR